MSYTDQDVEEVINAYFVSYNTSKNARGQTADASTVHRKAHEQGVRAARAALEAMGREPLEDVLEPDNVTDVHVMWCRTGDDEGEWRAFLNRDQIVSAERTWFGTGATIDAAIRNAVAAAKEER